MNEEEFKKSYHPTHKFNRGIIKLYHDDLQPQIKDKNSCGFDLTCLIIEQKEEYKNNNDLILLV